MYPQLLLITQLHRSGGTLFSQLLDGHSAVQAHPHELFIGKPQKWNWPKLAKLLTSPALLFESLQEDKIAAIGRQGVFIKPGSNLEAGKQDVSFTYSLTDHRERFVKLYSQAPVQTQRLAIQIYLHTFFSAWPEYHSSGHERYVSCFLPHLILHSDSLRRLFTDFPDVMLVSLLRRPDSWIASLVNHISLSLADTESVQKQLERWRLSVKAILTLHRNPAVYGFTTTYEALVSNPRTELQRFCTLAGLPFEPIMLTPTVGGCPVLPNSSYSRAQHGVNQSSLRPQQPLPSAVQQLLKDVYLPIYVKAVTQLGIDPFDVDLVS